MKIREFAEEKGLSKQAIYKAISRAGLSAKQITDRNGNITGKGFSTLRSLFPDPDSKENGSGDSQQQSTEQATEQQKAELDRLYQRITELENRCSEWERRYFEAVEQAKQERQQLRVLLSQEQQLRLAAENKGFFRRLFAGKKTDEQQ